MNRMGGARPGAVRDRATDDAGSGTRRPEAPGRTGTPGRDPLPTRFSGLPALPPDCRVALDAGLEAVGLSLDAAEKDALESHARLLLAWTGAINLTAIRDPAAVVREHLLDSLAAVPLLRDLGVDRFVDLGSGGGFPGVPLAIALPARRALLVESIGKKARFLEVLTEALAAEDLPPRPDVLEVAAVRAESLVAVPGHRERWPAVVARAVAGLAELAELAFPLLDRGGVLVAWKRRPLDEELAEARRILPVLGGGRIEILPVPVAGLEDHVLVVAEKERATPAAFPRPVADRRRSR